MPKARTSPAEPIIAALAAGLWFGRMMPAHAPVTGNPTSADEPEILYWVAPMDSNYRRDGPGKSPNKQTQKY